MVCFGCTLVQLECADIFASNVPLSVYFWETFVTCLVHFESTEFFNFLCIYLQCPKKYTESGTLEAKMLVHSNCTKVQPKCTIVSVLFVRMSSSPADSCLLFSLQLRLSPTLFSTYDLYDNMIFMFMTHAQDYCHLTTITTLRPVFPSSPYPLGGTLWEVL